MKLSKVFDSVLPAVEESVCFGALHSQRLIESLIARDIWGNTQQTHVLCCN